MIAMNGLLDGRLALITGAGSGIGEGIARAMAANGAGVIVADVNAAGAERVATSIGGDIPSLGCVTTLELVIGTSRTHEAFDTRDARCK